jgi:hypothetical protein
MKCADVEILLTDYIDETIGTAERAAVESHVSACTGCAETLRDIQATMAFLERVEAPEPPPELITRVLFQAPLSGQTHPERGRKGIAGWVRGWFSPLLQPRFAMGMAMTILSFSMVGRIAGVPQRQLTLSDIEPARVWAAVDDKVHRAWNRAVKYYENLRLVYEIQGRLQQWSDQEEEERKAQAGSHIEPKTPPAGASTSGATSSDARKEESRTGQPRSGEGSKNQ